MFFGRQVVSFFRKSVSPLSRVVVALGVEDERRASWPSRLPTQMCYGKIPPPNRWSSDQVPLQDRKTKRTVAFKVPKISCAHKAMLFRDMHTQVGWAKEANQSTIAISTSPGLRLMPDGFV